MPKCPDCNGPLWRREPCRVCSLTRLTSQDVRWHADEIAGVDSRGYAITAQRYYVAWDAARSDPTLVDRCNATDNTAATSTAALGGVPERLFLAPGWTPRYAPDEERYQWTLRRLNWPGAA